MSTTSPLATLEMSFKRYDKYRANVPSVRIERYDRNDERVIGRVYINDENLFMSYELPDKDNQHGTSCIPVGDYTCVRHVSEAHPIASMTYMVQNVPNRNGILIHSGNTYKDSKGCILLGMFAGQMLLSEPNGKQKYVDAVLNSTMAMSEFGLIILDRPFGLKIINV